MPALMDITGERPSCMPKLKEDSFLPVIGSNRGSQSSSQGDSPHNNNNHYQQAEVPRGMNSRCPSVADSLRLPNIDRSKTNSICSFASNSTCVSRARRTNSFRIANHPELCRSPSCPNLAELDNALFTENDEMSPPELESPDLRDIKTRSEHQLSNSIKLPTIGKCKENNVLSKRRTNVNNNAERGRARNDANNRSDFSSFHNGELSLNSSMESSVFQRHLGKGKSSSMRQLSEEREETSSVSSDRVRRSESLNSVHNQTSHQMPLLFPIRHNESRGSRRSKKTSRLGRTQDTLKENQLREVAEKLETIQNINQDDGVVLLPGTTTQLNGGSSRKKGYIAPSHTPSNKNNKGMGSTKEVLRRSANKEVLQSRAIKDNYENTRKKQTNS